MYLKQTLILAFSVNFVIHTSSYGIEDDNAAVPCFNNATCSIDLPGSKCVDFHCICMVKSGCKPHKVRSVIQRVGEDCSTNEDCPIEHTVCSSFKKCECVSGWLPTQDKKKCYEAISKSLGSDCIDSVQCTVQNAECINKTCRCAINTYTRDGGCYERLGLGERCSDSEQCFVLNSHCVDGVCGCRDEFIYHENFCLLPARSIFSECYEDIQCKRTLGEGSFCSNSVCACLDQFDYRDNVNMCMKTSGSSSLGIKAFATVLLYFVTLC